MDNISLHIEYLLLRHDCVILPGIGAFINIYQASFFDKNSGHIIPPSREIRFNPALRSDDGMLANSIARKMSISYREGSEILSRTVTDLGQSLLSDQEVTIGRLGIIRREQEGNIRFYPFKSVEKRHTELGLISVPFTKGSSLESSRIEEQEIKSLENYNEDTEQPVSSNTLNLLEDDQLMNKRIAKMNFKRNYYLPINKMFIRACACLLIVSCFAIAWLNTSDTSNQVEERASVLPIDKMIDTAVQKSREEGKSSGKIEETVIDEDIPSIDNDLYHLIVATCTSNEEAEQFIKTVSPTGFDLRIIPSRKLYRVSAGGSSDRQELLGIMRSAEFKERFKEAWIWEKQ